MKINKETLQKIILEEIKGEMDRNIDADSLGIESDGSGAVSALGNRGGSEAIPAIVAKRKFGLLYRYADHKMKQGAPEDSQFKLFKATRAYAKKALALQNEIEKIRNSILNLVPAFKKEENN